MMWIFVGLRQTSKNQCIFYKNNFKCLAFFFHKKKYILFNFTIHLSLKLVAENLIKIKQLTAQFHKKEKLSSVYEQILFFS